MSSTSLSASSTVLGSYVCAFGAIIWYYMWLKPTDTAELNLTSFCTFFAVLLIGQFFCNILLIVQRCGGAVNKNIGAAMLITFIPWVAIFGITFLLILIIPELKTHPANVLGYFYVMSSANAILTEILVDTSTQPKIAELTSTSDKTKMQMVADAIVKICSDKSVLINEITPLNFDTYWENVLDPIMKEQYQVGNNKIANEEYRKKFFAVVLSRDTIGEVVWVVYMTFLLLSLTNFKIMSYQCEADAVSQQESNNTYLAQKASIQQANQKASSTVYTM